jgi:hypothetical protein
MLTINRRRNRGDGIAADPDGAIYVPAKQSKSRRSPAIPTGAGF